METFDLGCAVLSSAAYQAGRNLVNQTPVVPGAVQIDAVSWPPE